MKLKIKSFWMMLRHITWVICIENLAWREKLWWTHRAWNIRRSLIRLNRLIEKTRIPVSGTDIDVVTKMRELAQKPGESDDDYINRVMGAMLSDNF